MGTMSEARDFGSSEAGIGIPPFAIYRNWIWTFSDPNHPASVGLKKHVLQEEIHRVTKEELLGPLGPGLAMPRLLNMALSRYLVTLGLRPRQEAGRIRVYFPSDNGERREITYHGLFKRATRTVTRPVTSRSTGRVIYWEHKAVALRVSKVLCKRILV